MDLDASHGRAAAALRTGGKALSRFVDTAALNVLSQLGFLQRVASGADEAAWVWRAPALDDHRLLRLLNAFDLQLEVERALDDCTWIALAIPEGETVSGPRRHNELFSGSGFTPADAVRSCLGEFAEFQSWLFRPGDVGRTCTRASLGESALDPQALLGFNASQLALGRQAVDDPGPSAEAFEGEIGWTVVEDLRDRKMHWLPAQLCYGRCPDAAWRNDSNGCAAGPSAQQALAAAIHELIERDATGIWWYGQCPRPAIDAARLEHPKLTRALEARAAHGLRVHLLDLTHDLGVPVVAATLLDAAGRLQALGFGCKADLSGAAASAYLELCQMELSIELTRRRAAQAGDAAAAGDVRLLSWLAAADVRRFPFLAPDSDAWPEPPHAFQDNSAVTARLAASGNPAYRLDLTRSDIGIPAVRVFAPGLCHYKPRLGHARLVDVPRRLGWRDADFGAADLNPSPLLI